MPRSCEQVHRFESCGRSAAAPSGLPVDWKLSATRGSHVSRQPIAAVIILAAGAGTRMNSATPKVLHSIAGRSLLHHAIVAANELEPSRLVVVVRHERDAVAAAASAI